MTNELIQTLQRSVRADLIETHISWLLIGEEFAYKIKKPVKYSFLDFSTIDLRKHYCEREITLNRRLTKNIYLEVVEVCRRGDDLFFGGDGHSEIIDYAVKMNKMNPGRRMDVLLQAGKVGTNDVYNIADQLIIFHQEAVVIEKYQAAFAADKFNDIEVVCDFLERANSPLTTIIGDALSMSDRFLKRYQGLIYERVDQGWVRDVHGDLHSRNIFLLDKPVIFDCIEFNDDYRRMDLLDELAFFCMDLDAFGYPELGTSFLEYYNSHHLTMKTDADQELFLYFKAYRANVRAKVNALRAQSAQNKQDLDLALQESERYLKLMMSYFKLL